MAVYLPLILVKDAYLSINRIEKRYLLGSVIKKQCILLELDANFQ